MEEGVGDGVRRGIIPGPTQGITSGGNGARRGIPGPTPSL